MWMDSMSEFYLQYSQKAHPQSTLRDLGANQCWGSFILVLFILIIHPLLLQDFEALLHDWLTVCCSSWNPPPSKYRTRTLGTIQDLGKSTLANRQTLLRTRRWIWWRTYTLLWRCVFGMQNNFNLFLLTWSEDQKQLLVHEWMKREIIKRQDWIIIICWDWGDS